MRKEYYTILAIVLYRKKEPLSNNKATSDIAIH